MSDSDDDSSCSDSDGSDVYVAPVPGAKGGMLGSFMVKEKKKRGDLTQFEGFDEDDDGTVVQKMKTIMALRESLGIDDDVAFNLEQDKKDKEKKRLAAMSSDERMQYEESQAGDVMSKIRAKHAEKLAEKEKEAEIARQKAEAERLEDEKIYAEEQAQELAELEAKRAAEVPAKKKKLKKKPVAEEEEEDVPVDLPLKKKKSKKPVPVEDDEEPAGDTVKKKKKKKTVEDDEEAPEEKRKKKKKPKEAEEEPQQKKKSKKPVPVEDDEEPAGDTVKKKKKKKPVEDGEKRKKKKPKEP
jgi:hypothetical protein